MDNIVPSAENNGLFFIETSALDSTNLEDAFQNMLTFGNEIQIYNYCEI